MRRRVAGFIALCVANTVIADDIPIENGRYAGPVVDFEPTAEQIEVIEHFRRCHLGQFKTMNAYTPYVFSLTSEQSATLVQHFGHSPERFAVYETVRGYNDAGPHWNVALRYSENHIEIPVPLLLRDVDANAARREQGWLPDNPCFPKLQSR